MRPASCESGDGTRRCYSSIDLGGIVEGSVEVDREREVTCLWHKHA